MPTTAAPSPLPGITDEPMLSRRRFVKFLVFGAPTAVVASTAYGRWWEPYWVRYREITLRFKDLPSAFSGVRITQISDLHLGNVPMSYLRRILDAINELDPDLVLVTGDLLHQDSTQYQDIANLLEAFEMPVIATLGNHDFQVGRHAYQPSTDQADRITAALRKVGIIVLRNQVFNFLRGEQVIHIVGLDDLWSGQFDPAPAFGQRPLGENFTIAMSHNPDTLPDLIPYKPQLILSGHTHGGQVRIPFLGAPILPTEDRRHDWGLFNTPTGKLYVTSGVGYTFKVRMFCRPEVVTFTLQNA